MSKAFESYAKYMRMKERREAEIVKCNCCGAENTDPEKQLIGPGGCRVCDMEKQEDILTNEDVKVLTSKLAKTVSHCMDREAQGKLDCPGCIAFNICRKYDLEPWQLGSWKKK